MTNVLKMFENKYYQTAYNLGLTLIGIEDGRPKWLGNTDQMNKYFEITAQYD